MLKPNYHLSTLEGIEFFISQDSSFLPMNGEGESGCTCSDPFNLCLRTQMMALPDGEYAEFF